MTTLRPGDLVELRLDAGRAYILVTHLHPTYRDVVYVFPGLHEQRCDPETLNRDGWYRLFPLSAKLGLRLVGNIVAKNYGADLQRAFPFFRIDVKGRDGVRLYSWIWDGEEVRPAKGDEAALLPERRITTLDELSKLLQRSTLDQSK